MTKKPSPARSAALTGALLGAVCRPVVVSAFWLLDERRADTWITVLFTSCTIGLLLGAFAGWVAGSIRNPLTSPVIGATVGAGLTFGSAIVTVVLLCMATYRPQGPDVDVGLYWATMALTGAFPGISGGLVGNRVRQRQAAASLDAQHREEDRPDDGTSDRSA